MADIIKKVSLQKYPQAIPGMRRGMWARVMHRLFSGYIEEAISTSIADSNYVMEKYSKDSDVTERTTRSDRFSRLEWIRKAYKGEATWGNAPCAAVINFNRTFQMAQGLSVVAEEGKEGEVAPELEIVQHFLDFNDLMEQGGLELAAAGELDGQVLLTWVWDEEWKQVRLQHIPLFETKYRVLFENGQPFKVILHPDTENEKELESKDFVFIRFRGTPNGTYGIPTPMPCIQPMEDVEKARADLRKINHLFAAPTPIFKMKNEARVNEMKTLIEGMNWKIGKGLAMMVEEGMELVEIGGQGSDQLKAEILENLQVIAAVTDVPIHFLGHPEQLSNRATSHDLFEPPIKRAQGTQLTWIGGFEEMLEKVIPIYNTQLQVGQSLDASKVSILFPPIKTDSPQELVAAWLPARIAKQISHHTFLKKVGIDEPDKELELLMAEADQVVDEEEQNQEEERAIDQEIERAAQEELEGAAGG